MANKKAPRPGGVLSKVSRPSTSKTPTDLGAEVGKLELRGATSTGHRAPLDPRAGLPGTKIWR